MPEEQPQVKIPRPVIRKTYPKFRFWDMQKNMFFFSSNALFGAVGDQDKHDFIAPHVIVTHQHTEKKLNTDDLQYISEFTGVLDSNAAMIPIFSGDRVLIKNPADFNKEYKLIVQWVITLACWNISPYLVTGCSIFVVGNVYQNPSEKEDIKFDFANDLPSLKKRIVN